MGFQIELCRQKVLFAFKGKLDDYMKHVRGLKSAVLLFSPVEPPVGVRGLADKVQRYKACLDSHRLSAAADATREVKVVNT